MSGFLLDTNVISEFNRKGEPDLHVRNWLEAADSGSLYISVPTFGKVRMGIDLLAAGKRKTQRERWLDQDLPQWFEGRILSVDQRISDRWGSLRARGQLKGKSLSVVDALLAATALTYNLTLVSRNVSDFPVAELALVNPWEARR
jgi:predicted nucleic acid-binding protein